MNVQELEQDYRVRARDRSYPYLADSEEVLSYLNEAEREACQRMDLLRAAEADPGITALATTVGMVSISLSPLLLRVTHAQWQAAGSDCREELCIVVDRLVLDRQERDWRTRSCKPRHLLVENSSARFDCLPSTAGTLYIEGWRLPLVSMLGDSDVPEIAAVHHDKLVEWAVYRAYRKPEGELRDPSRAQAAYGAFETWFGYRVDADLRQALEAPGYVQLAEF